MNTVILLCVNSDVGRGNTIGYRFGKIAQLLREKNISFNLICRSNYLQDIPACSPPWKNFLARALNALRMYVFPKFDLHWLELKVFDKYVLHKLKKNTDIYGIAHFGEFLPRSIQYLKQKGVKIYLDCPMGHWKFAEDLRDKGIQVGVGTSRRLYMCIDQSIQYADVLVVPSSFVKKTIEDAGFSDKKMIQISFGVDIPNIPISADDIKKKLTDKKLKFLFAGTVNYRKGIIQLLEAWQKLTVTDVQLIICGRVYKELKNEVKKYNFENVIFKGFVNLKQEFDESHVFVFPTLLEGSAKVVYEALGNGLPVITTFNAGSVVEDGQDGYIIPEGDSNALAERMMDFYSHRELIYTMGMKAIEKAKKYSWETYAHNVVTSYLLGQ